MNSKINNDNSVAELLKQAWDQVWKQLIEPDNSWKNNPEKCSLIQQRLSHFNVNHLDTENHIDKTIKAITRGIPLIQSAIEWQDPRVGKKSQNKFDRFRGSQWRLVIAYSGFEITVKALLLLKEKPLTPELIATFLKNINLPKYQELSYPNPRKNDNFKKWLNKENGSIAEFLGVRGADKKSINSWIFEQNTVETWLKSFQLAKALRNASAHGYLLPKKVKDWDLESGFSKLADDLGIIIAYALQQLIKSQ
ncbi:MAG: hypothetical protein AB4058_07435 [Microcystaceae cyanobacterium]